MVRTSPLESTADLTLKERDQALEMIRAGSVATVLHRGRVVRLETEADVHKVYPALRKVRPTRDASRGR